jgi:hypothetical protein
MLQCTAHWCSKRLPQEMAHSLVKFSTACWHMLPDSGIDGSWAGDVLFLSFFLSSFQCQHAMAWPAPCPTKKQVKNARGMRTRPSSSLPHVLQVSFIQGVLILVKQLHYPAASSAPHFHLVDEQAPSPRGPRDTSYLRCNPNRSGGLRRSQASGTQSSRCGAPFGQQLLWSMLVHVWLGETGRPPGMQNRPGRTQSTSTNHAFIASGERHQQSAVAFLYAPPPTSEARAKEEAKKRHAGRVRVPSPTCGPYAGPPSLLHPHPPLPGGSPHSGGRPRSPEGIWTTA